MIHSASIICVARGRHSPQCQTGRRPEVGQRGAHVGAQMFKDQPSLTYLLLQCLFWFTAPKPLLCQCETAPCSTDMVTGTHARWNPKAQLTHKWKRIINKGGWPVIPVWASQPCVTLLRFVNFDPSKFSTQLSLFGQCSCVFHQHLFISSIPFIQNCRDCSQMLLIQLPLDPNIFVFKMLRFKKPFWAIYPVKQLSEVIWNKTNCDSDTNPIWFIQYYM